MCLFLPLGYAFLTVDLYYDLRWCCWPSKRTKSDLQGYYTFLLTPKGANPGYWFPLYAMFVFLIQCPNKYNWMTFWLFVPIGMRYVGLLTGKDRKLSHWWTIVVIRIVLYVVTYYNLQHRECVWSEYAQHGESLIQQLTHTTQAVAAKHWHGEL